MKRITIKGSLAIAAYAGAAGISIARWSDGFWFVAVVCLLMAAIRHPATGHLLCSLSLVLWTLIYTGEIGWMANYVPIIIIAPCIIFSAKMLEESNKPLAVPKWKSNGYNERLNAGMVFVGDGDD